ncbi:MAG: FtsX-like permease family protein [bacterium]|nr:FtsX-like permease family protein [bacterium]
MDNRDFRPPLIAERLLNYFLPDDMKNTAPGDFEEEYVDFVEESGRLRARIWYWSQVIKSIFLYLCNFFLRSTVMFKTYFKISLRNIKKNKITSMINIFGLALGISCCLIIFLYLQNELTYDRYHERSDQIYRISGTYVTSGEPIRFAPASPAIGPRLVEEYPEFEESARIFSIQTVLFKNHENNITNYESNIVAADPSVFSVFTYDFIHGDPETCLSEINNIVLTEELAVKFFGDGDPLGNVLDISGTDMKVTGVIKDPPQNSHLTIRGIVPFEILNERNRLNPSMYEILGFTYVLLQKDYDFNEFWDKWPDFYKRHCSADEVLYGQVFIPNFTKLTDIRYNATNFRADVPVGSRSYLYAFFAIGIFILALACINYINMTTAHAPTRAKEIGMKKVLGAARGSMIIQVMVESFIMTFIAFLISYIVLKLLFVFIQLEQLLGFNIVMSYLENPLLVACSGGLFLLIGFVSGIYPAFYITSFTPIKALSGVLKSGIKGLFTRRVLVTIQFSISIGIVVLMLFMNEQVDYMRNQELGFKKDNIVSLSLRGRDAAQAANSLKEELLKDTGVVQAGFGFNVPGRAGTGLYRFEGIDGIEEHNYNVFVIGQGYIETLGLELINGRAFDINNHPSDPGGAILVNEALVKDMKWDDPIGKQVTQGRFQATVIGVVKDFNFHSLHNEIDPLLIRMRGRPGGRLLLKIRGENIIQTMNHIEEAWGEFIPNQPYEYTFLDEEFGELYNEDQRQNELIKIFSTICLLISCLGVLGLSSFNAIRRTKEIAIRKVHGASFIQIILILFKEFFYIILAASILMSPISFVVTRLWLNNFAYKTDFNILFLIGTVFGSIIIAFMTAGYHSIKVAGANPIKWIRYE